MRNVMILAAVLCISGGVFAACPSMDLSGNCRVDLVDFSLLADQWLTVYDPNDLTAMASQWLTEGTPPPILTWVSINDPGVPGHEVFIGEMSKYEITNAQYCQYLNDAYMSGDVVVSGYHVMGANGTNSGTDFVEQNYYDLADAGWTVDGATDGGASRINWTGSSFTVDFGFENHPLTCVSWFGATAFASYYGWRLPTEWEWQAVADYNGTYTYGCGPDITNNIANYYGSTHPDGTTDVGAFGTYGYGMADMAGNVYEWTNSCLTPDCSDVYRIIRGGCWYDPDSNCMVTYRNYTQPYTMIYNLGFRVCR